MKLNYEIIASLSAIVVAVAALGVAIYEARVTREHQELSVWAISIELCYCSLYKKCWLLHKKNQHKEVKNCK